MFSAIAEEAPGQGLPLAGHVPRGLTVEQVVEAGQPSIELAALQTATINPARYLGIEQKAGSVARGHRADLVLLDANPLSDIANVRRIRAVVVAGRLLDRRALDETLTQARAAAAR